MTDARECPCSRPADPHLCPTCLRALHTTIHTTAPRLAILLRPVVAKTAKAGCEDDAHDHAQDQAQQRDDRAAAHGRDHA